MVRYAFIIAILLLPVASSQYALDDPNAGKFALNSESQLTGGNTYYNTTQYEYNNYTNITQIINATWKLTTNYYPIAQSSYNLTDGNLYESLGIIKTTNDKVVQFPCTGSTSSFPTSGAGIEMSCYNADSYIQRYNRSAGTWNGQKLYIRAGELYLGSYGAGANTTMETSVKFSSNAYFSSAIESQNIIANIPNEFYTGTLSLKSNGTTRYQFIGGDGGTTSASADWLYLRAWNRTGSYVGDDGFKINYQTGTSAIHEPSPSSSYALTIGGMGLYVKNLTYNLNGANKNNIYSYLIYSPTSDEGTYRATGLFAQIEKQGAGNWTSSDGASGMLGSVYNNGAGSISNAVGVQAILQQATTAGVITNGYNFKSWNPTTSTNGNITNMYGFYTEGLDEAGVGTAYGFYSAGASDLNYFAGNVSIGASNPSRPLSVTRANEGVMLSLGANAVNDLLYIAYNGGTTSIVSSQYGPLYFTTANNQNITITPNGLGNLGIASSTPTQKLFVQGNITASDEINATRLCIASDCRSSWPAGGSGTYNITYDATSQDVTANRSNWFSKYNASYESTYNSTYASKADYTNLILDNITNPSVNISRLNLGVGVGQAIFINNTAVFSYYTGNSLLIQSPIATNQILINSPLTMNTGKDLSINPSQPSGLAWVYTPYNNVLNTTSNLVYNPTTNMLIASGNITATDINATRLCIGTDCRSSWPAGGSGTYNATYDKWAYNQTYVRRGKELNNSNFTQIQGSFTTMNQDQLTYVNNGDTYFVWVKANVNGTSSQTMHDLYIDNVVVEGNFLKQASLVDRIPSVIFYSGVAGSSHLMNISHRIKNGQMLNASIMVQVFT